MRIKQEQMYFTIAYKTINSFMVINNKQSFEVTHDASLQIEASM